ncbi:MAG: restriction endonuclease subunit M, partial [Bacteroidetes bacterium]|nr:restriction endonuclease subunit M [Bacteroidota bacterium]
FIPALLTKNKELMIVKNEFIEFIKNKFPVEKLSSKLQSWYELDYKGFLEELTKAKLRIPLIEQFDWQSLFNSKKSKALELKSVIDRTDKEIDRMVYELYGLTEEEIRIVEEG